MSLFMQLRKSKLIKDRSEFTTDQKIVQKEHQEELLTFKDFLSRQQSILGIATRFCGSVDFFK